MRFFDLPPKQLPSDAQYYFDVLVVAIAIRESLQTKDSRIQDYWDITNITKPRPYVIHIYTEDDLLFMEDENYFLDLFDHSVVEISQSQGICFYDLVEFEEDENIDEDGELRELENPDDLWRLD